MTRAGKGQATVELALVISLLLMPLVFGLVEFSWALGSYMTIGAATREGARMGGNLANGGGDLGCGTGQSPNWTTVDPQIVAAVERSIAGSGTLLKLENVIEIRIWKADANGSETSGKVNIWTYTPGAGPTIDGTPLDFSEQSEGWRACERNNVVPSADAVGVTVRYTYRAQTPLRFFMPAFATVTLGDKTVMPLNATK